MMFKKRIYAVCATAGLIIGALGVVPISAVEEAVDVSHTQMKDTSAATPRFSDVLPENWFYPYVEYLAGNGIVKGMTETEFAPGGTFTVAESAAIITRYLGLESAAADRKNAMQLLNIKGSDRWYAGYIQLMYEAGIIDVEKYGCTVYDRHIAIDSYSLLEAPVKRYEFIAFVIRSFELGGTQIRTGEDKTGTGSEFIWNGAYDESILERYIPHIKDYASIPSEYSYYVLKAYYNGIINGDNYGNFNPMNNLSRAEMAKIAAVIIDMEQRVRIDISIPLRESYSIGADGYVVKKNDRYLKPSVSDEILQSEVTGISLVYENNQPVIVYKSIKDAPEDYSFVYYHFTKDKSGFDVDIKKSIKSDEYTYKSTYTPGDRFILTLTNEKSGETVDAYEITLLQSGMTRKDSCSYQP